MKKSIRLPIILIIVMITVVIFVMAPFSKINDFNSVVHAEDKLKNSVIMYIGSPNAIVNGSRVLVDKLNPELGPVISNDTVLIPLRFTAEGFGAEVGWDGKTAAITVDLGKSNIKLKQGGDTIISNGREYKLSSPVTAIKGRTYVPLEIFAEALGKKVFNNRGLIVISDNENILDSEEDKSLIDDLVSRIGGLPTVGSYEKLVELLMPLMAANSSEIMYGTRPAIAPSIAMDVKRDDDSITMQSESKVAEAPKLNAKASTTSETSNAGASASSDLQADNSSDYSTTNVQVQGVDEADIIKTDGKYIYQVNRDRIVIAKAYPAEEMKIESIISFNDAEFYPQEMYLHGNKLVVIGNSYVRNIIPQNSDSGQTKNSGSLQTRDSALTEKKIYPQPYYYQSQTVKAIMYDVSNKSDIKKLREFEIEGYYISSRKVGPYLYMVANKNIDYYYIMERSPVQIAPVDPEISVKSNQDGFKSAPSYRDTASGDKFIDIDLKNVCYFPGIIQPNYMIVAGINLDKDDEKANLSTYLGTGQNIYASLENLYVTVTNYSIIEQVQEINPQNNIEGSIKDAPTDGSTTAVETNKDTASVAVTVTAKDVLADSNAAVTVTAKDAVTVIASAPAIKPNVAVIRRPPMNQENTLIYKFSLNNGTVTYLGKGEVPGRILNQFSMDENDKYFRIATTRGEIWRNDEFTSKNNIYVLDEMLNIKGKVEDIAPGEQIYSVRFMGDRAYMVTFKLTDPLFVIDLKNPQEPCILGALKIPGYSDYLHPYDENHIIGFGKDSVEIKGQAFYLGMKIALFDVTDVSNPIQKFSETIGDRGTDSELLRNHKALLFSKEKELMAFPVTVMEIKSGSKFADGGFPNYGQFTFQGAYVYNIDLIKGFTLKSRITHLDKDDMLKAGVSWYDNEKNINRIIYINDTLYTLSNRMFKAHGLNDMKEKNIVTIP